MGCPMEGVRARSGYDCTGQGVDICDREGLQTSIGITTPGVFADSTGMRDPNVCGPKVAATIEIDEIIATGDDTVDPDGLDRHFEPVANAVRNALFSGPSVQSVQGVDKTIMAKHGWATAVRVLEDGNNMV